jgi:membrane-associated protease RseP (regulator of RpoE activity)
MSAIFYRRIRSPAFSYEPSAELKSDRRRFLHEPSSDFRNRSRASHFMLSYIACLIIALLIHELGHLLAARACSVPVTEFGLGWGRKLFGFRAGDVEYKVHALPVGAYVRLDIEELQRRPLSQQTLVLLAGVIVNLVAATMAGANRFAMMNLILAATNLLPIYQQDGWKCGIVMLRALLRRRNALVEWTFTISGAAVSLLFFVTKLRHLI